MQCFIKLLFFVFVVIITCETSPQRQYATSTTRSINNRLSGNAIPSAYTIKLTLEQDWSTTNNFSGTVTITFKITNATDQFEFHAKNLEITELTLLRGNSPVEVTYTPQPDPETDFITVSSNSTQFEVADNYLLTITYNGQLSETSMVGFYKSTYVDKSGVERFLAASQFEEIHARKAFPCFDEPEMKATFSVQITCPVGYFALSNTASGTPAVAGSLQTTKFSKTPQLSTYLLAFIVADDSCFKCKTASAVTYGKFSPQVCSRNSYTDVTSETALEAVSPLYDILSSYTTYTLTNMGKMSLAAIPDFAPGAMENWGMITFRESYLLWDQNESSNYDEQKIITVIAHELSHQWFGDLVTLEWWSDVFLNEGFATFFQYHAAALYRTEWELEKQFVVEQLQTALVTDSLDSALPLSYDADNADYSSRFDDISYNKGASILRMVYHFLGDLNFKNGLKDYLSGKALSNVIPGDLWDSLDTYAQELIGSKTLPARMNEIMENWTTKPGYPVLVVSKVGNNLTITQEQFLLSGTPAKTEWYVPLTYTLSDSTDGFENMDTKMWLSPGKEFIQEGMLKDVDWIILNNQQAGYYRVSYTTNLWDKIVGTLRTNLSTINELNRAQLVDDQMNFARAGRITYGDLLKFLTFLKKDDSYYSWTAAFNGFSHLFYRISDDDVHNALANYVLDQMQSLSDSVPIDAEDADNQIYTLKQVLALTWACKLGDENCIKVTRRMFDDHKTGKTISRNLKSVIYCSVLRNSQTPTEDFRFLWEKYLDTQLATERVTILKTLGCSNDGEIRRNYLLKTLTKDVRRQDASIVFASVYSNNAAGVWDVLNFIYGNHKIINSYFGSSSTLTSLINSISGYIVTQKHHDRLEAITKLEDLDDNVKASAIASLDRVKTNLKVAKDLEDNLRHHFQISSGSANLLTNLALPTIVCLLLTRAFFLISY